MSRNRLPCFGLLLCLAVPASALEVQARLDTDSIRHGETVALILESDVQPEAGPDLGPLSRDFRIVGRSSSRQIHEINGRREEHHELRLILSPLRSGHLEIPAIAFGEAVTRPLPLNVGNGADGASPEPAPPHPSITAALPAPWPLTGGQDPAQAPSHRQPPSGAGLPETQPPPPTGSPADEGISPSPPPPPAPASRAPGNTASPTPWFRTLAGWPGFLTVLVALGLLIWGWRWGRSGVSREVVMSRRSKPETAITTDPGRGKPSPPPEKSQVRGIDPQGPGGPVATPGAEGPDHPADMGQHHQPLPADPIAAAIAEVRHAYEDGEAGVARGALLAWAALVLPERPPGNLALLAKRCREPLRSEILLLEQAFFSPHPLDWERKPVWERLPAFAPLPSEEPATFRQKRPLRRPASPA